MHETGIGIIADYALQDGKRLGTIGKPGEFGARYSASERPAIGFLRRYAKVIPDNVESYRC